MSRKSRTQSQPSVVEKLIEQRRLIQEWLAKLAGGTAEAMPPHVVERVRNDYTARLASVTKELGEHADGVRQSLDEQQLRHAELEKEQGALRDELAELRLRRQVGEIDEGRFKDQSQKLKSGIDELGKELANSARDIDRLEEILDSMEREEEGEGEGEGEGSVAERVATEAASPPPSLPSPLPPRSEPTPEAVVAPAAERDAEPVKAADEEPEKEPAKEAAKEPAKEVAKEPTPEVKPPVKESPKEPAKEAPAPPGDEMSFLRSVTGVISAQKPPLKGGAPAAGAAASGEGEKPFYVLEQMPQPEEEGKVRASKAAGEGERTLVCAECGTKNLPTEWYCEKCGAELTNF